MAVQAAIMNPHFIHFCFPSSSMEYELESAYNGALLGEMENAGELKETTNALLNFIDSASSNIKLALDKPVKSKRKVNHRKYLQKQIKRCTGMISVSGSGPGTGQEAGSKKQASPPSSTPSAATGHFQCKPPPKKDGSQSSLQSKSLAALFDSVRDLQRSAAGGSSKKVPLRNRNLPPSFFTEPANVKITSTSGMSLKDLERGNPEAAEFFELLGPDYSNMISSAEPFPVRIPQQGSYELGAPDSYRGSESFSHFPDPWLQCNPSKKSPPAGWNLSAPESARTAGGLTPLYPSSQPTNASPMDEPPGTLAAFSPFFPECSLPQVSYEYSPGFNCGRQAFPGL
ncbi:protein FAM181B [Narcine bancroftii]|uniref:protein FAM181B n=1 Tax=Narcine bancroftii TaxID=1343680 RepID=UPI0038322600